MGRRLLAFTNAVAVVTPQAIPGRVIIKAFVGGGECALGLCGNRHNSRYHQNYYKRDNCASCYGYDHSPSFVPRWFVTWLDQRRFLFHYCRKSEVCSLLALAESIGTACVRGIVEDLISDKLPIT